MDNQYHRWQAVITYYSQTGVKTTEYSFSELSTLHDLVELGPNWDAIRDIVIKRTNCERPLTIEEAEEQE